jgi:DNA primase catalytic core
MARIPDTAIDQLKKDVSVERLIEAAGIVLKKSGKDKTGCCPFHEDDTASLVVTPAKNLWHCFGCGAGGDPIAWVMKLRGISFRHAVELLQADPSLAAEGINDVPIKSIVRTLPAPVTFDADDQALLNQTVNYYHQTLLISPEAQAYLQERGLTHPDLITEFKLGYANRSLGLRLPDKTRKAGLDIRTRLEKIGIYRSSGHEHFNGSLVVPIIDEHGSVTEVYGRKITDGLRKGTPLHLYLPAEQRIAGRGIFNVKALAHHQEIILCESLIDAMTFWCAGYRNVTTSYGIEGFTEEHLAALKQHGTQRVLIAYDRDEAGERGAASVAERLSTEGIACFRIHFPKGMDANEYALRLQPASKALGMLIRQAAWLGNGAAPARPDTVVIAPVTVVNVPSLAAQEDVIIPSLPLPIEPLPEPPTEPLPASPCPPAPTVISEPEVRENELIVSFGERRYRVRGLAKNLAFDLLKVNILTSVGDAFYVDTLDLYNARARQSYITQAAVELRLSEATLKADLGRVLLTLESVQEKHIQATLMPKLPEAVQMSSAERDAALALLRDPNLMERLQADCTTCGLVGENINKLVGYLAAISRKLDKPLGVVIQSSSAAGKTSLMDTILAFVPDEDKVKYSAMTGQSLFYMGETNLKHKALAIVEEEGASRASYALKLLQSEGELTIASTGKDPITGNLVTQPYHVEGPVALLLTTTARDLDEELLNRCLILSVDESRDQTRAIHHLQRAKRTLNGMIAAQEKADLIAVHQNAQRLLRPIAIFNPYVQWLTFPDQTTRLRRDHEKYLTLIDTIAFLHQHQREIRSTHRGAVNVEYIEVTLDDIALANRIAHEVLGRSLDELPPQTRRLLITLDSYVNEQCVQRSVQRSDCRFSRRTLREAINWGDTQLKLHLARLVELEYIVTHRTANNGFDYELVYEPSEDGHRLRFPGLADIAPLKHAYDASRSGQNTARSASGRGVVGPQSPPGRDAVMRQEPTATPPNTDLPDRPPEMPGYEVNEQIVSYPHSDSSLAASCI